MYFRVQTDEMNYGLGMVIRAVSPRPVKQVYDGVLIETVEDGLILTCTDGEISIKAHVNAMVEEDGCALLPAKLFAEMMRKQPVGEVEVDESRKILTGILMEVYEKETLLVGLDGFRLSLQRIRAENTLPDNLGKDHIHAVAPGRVLGEVSKMLPDTDDMAIVTFNSWQNGIDR